MYLKLFVTKVSAEISFLGFSRIVIFSVICELPFNTCSTVKKIEVNVVQMFKLSALINCPSSSPGLNPFLHLITITFHIHISSIQSNM